MAIVGMHSRTIDVKDPCHLDSKIILPIIIKKQCFRASFTLIIAGADPIGIDMAQYDSGWG